MSGLTYTIGYTLNGKDPSTSYIEYGIRGFLDRLLMYEELIATGTGGIREVSIHKTLKENISGADLTIELSSITMGDGLPTYLVIGILLAGDIVKQRLEDLTALECTTWEGLCAWAAHTMRRVDGS